MKELLAVAVAPLCAGFLFAQADQTTRTETQTTTTKTTWNGTLVDAGCRSTHTEHTETSTTPEESTTTTRTETTTDCPVTAETAVFGLVTPEGKYVRFDEPSNTKIVELVKSNKRWNKYVKEHAPLKVRVIGTSNGDTVVLESIK